MRSLLLIIGLLVFAGQALPAPRDVQRNRLYAYESELRQRQDSLSRLPALPQSAVVNPLKMSLRRNWKARTIVAEGKGQKKKLRKGQIVTVLAKLNRGWQIVVDADTLIMPAPSKFRPVIKNHWQQWRADSLQAVLQFQHSIRLRAIEEDLVKRELGLVPELLKLYRKDGRHQRIDPAIMLRSRALPDYESPGNRLYYSIPVSADLSDTPWGLPSERLTQAASLLYFTGSEDDCLQFSSDNSSAPLYLSPLAIDAVFSTDLSQELKILAADWKMRKSAAREYRLLKMWTPNIVSQLLSGMAWKGMSTDMLLEALGEPASRKIQGNEQLWEYARGNVIRVAADRVIEISQSPSP